jgi:hypothetical protein
LSRLLMVTENYPNLKANQGFQDLRVQLEGTENRITVARNRYIKTVADYNVLARSFPTNLTAMVFNYEVKPSFTVANEAAISAPPSVNFETRPSGPGRFALRSFALIALTPLGSGTRRGAHAAAGPGELCGHRPTAQDVLPVPPLSGRIVDQTGHAERPQRAALDSKLPPSRRRPGRRSCCCWSRPPPRRHRGLRTTCGRRLEDRPREVGDGVLLVVAKNERKVRIEVAKALEGRDS